MTPKHKIHTFSNYLRMISKLERVVGDMEELNKMSGGELDDSKDDLTSMKKQMTDLKKMMGVQI